MNNDRTIATPANPDLATFTLKINGQEVPRTYQVMSVSVLKEVNKISYAKLVLLDGDPSKEDFEASNEELFIPGNEIEILAGYHLEEATIYRGVTIKHSLRIRKEGSSMLLVECRDVAFRMAQTVQNKYFLDMSDAEIVEELLNSYGLSSDVEPTETTHAQVVQHEASDWDFMISRIDANGMFCVIDDDLIRCITPDLSQEPVAHLRYGASILEMDAEMDGRNQHIGVKSFTWNAADQEIVEVEGAEPGFSVGGDISGGELAEALELGNYNIYNGGLWKDEDLQSIADAKMIKARLAKVTGRVKCQGLADLKPGTVVNIAGVGNRMSGNYFVTGVFHSIADGQWTSDIQFGADPEWFTNKVRRGNVSSNPNISSLLGLQVGIVSKLEDDPDGEDRIQVKLPIISPDDEGIWTRLACLDAGNERGTFFRPEVGDEVVVGFLGADMDSPVVLGMLHSSAKPTPESIAEDNNLKGFITRSKLKLVFDDEKKAVIVETPNGNLLSLDEDSGAVSIEDENGNKIIMDASGIAIESATDLMLKASGDVNLEGVNISQAAQSSFKAEGNSGVELSSSATATIKGSIVKIN